MAEQSVSLTLSPDPASAGRAREFVGATLGSSEADDMTEEAVLLTSELVTNAIVHVQSPMTVTVALDNQRLRVAVSDKGGMPSSWRDDTIPSDVSGRGLQLVDAVATSWGVEPVPGGKTVWFELSPA